MSLFAQVVTALVALTAALSAASLWRGADRHAGPVRHGYWLLAVAALLAGLGAIGQQAVANATAGAALPLTLADLPGLLALPTLVAGVASLRSRRETARHPLAQRRGRLGGTLALGADAYVLGCALFIICWITVFSAAYTRSGDDPAMFAGELVHPLADLLVLGGLLSLAVAAGRRGVAPLVALLAITLSDALAVGARVSNGHPGTAAQLLLIVGLCVLGSAPWLDARDAGHPEARQFPAAGLHATTAIAALAAALAALVVIGAALAGGPVARPVLAVVGGTAVLALTGRIIILVHRDGVRARLWQESGQQFRELADRTSDAVLVCDYSGLISYASPAVRDYGYQPEGLEGMLLADLVHPEDQPEGLRAVRERSHRAGHPDPVLLPGPGGRRHLAVRRSDDVPAPQPGRAGPAAGHRARRERPGRAAPADRPAHLPRRADRTAQPGLPGGPGAGSAQPGPPRCRADCRGGAGPPGRSRPPGRGRGRPPGRGRSRGWPGSSWSTWTASPE